MPEAVKVSSGAFTSLLGMDATKHADPKAQPDNVSFVSRYSKVEAKSFLKRLHTKPEMTRADVSAPGIITYLKPIHQRIGNQIIDVEKMKALAPEIEQARILVSSSIMSPNDLQDGEFIFTFSDIPAIDADPELAKEIAEVYNLFFNKTLELGIRSYDWIGDIQYSTGSKALLILPLATQMELRDRNIDQYHDQLKLCSGFASFDEYYKATLNDDFFYSEKPVTWKDALGTMSDSARLESMVPAMESFGVEVPTRWDAKKATSINTIGRTDEAKLFGDEYVAGLESMIVNLRTKLEEGDVIRVTENPEVLRFTTVRKENDKFKLFDKLKKKFNPRPSIEPVVFLNSNPEGYQHQGHPTLIELPSESVIPVHIPGAPKEHIGYFVLLDNNGQPLTIENSGMANRSTGCSGGSSAAAYEAMFGSNCANASYFTHNNKNLENISSSGNMIFQNMLECYLRTRMKGIFNRDDLSLARFNAVATTLFYRVLDQKETMLVFVPPTLLHYFAFDYDKSGVGRSKLAEAKFLLSLRTTLLMAQIVAMVNDAIEHKKIEFGVDDKVANLEAIMDMIADIFIAKNKLTGSIDPSEIMQDMYSNALTVVPKNIPGLTDMTVDVQSSGGSSVRPDDALLEQISNLLISHLDVLPAALNQMSEPEFARSLVTYNLFFAKKIARYQRIYCAMMTEFIRSFTSFDIPFQTAIRKKLEAAGKRRSRETHTPKVEEMKRKNPNQYSTDYSTILQAILEGVKVNLPTPNIVVDKTQYEELRNFMGNLQDLADNLFNSELIPSDDQAAANALPILKAKWKRDQMMRFIEQVGSFNMVELPDWDDLSADDIVDFVQTCQNTTAQLDMQRKNIGSRTEEGGFGGSGYGGDDYGGGGDDFGGGDDMGMDDMGGDDMGMDDMGGEEPAMEEPEAPEVSEEPEETTEEPAEASEEETATATMYARLYRPKKQ